MLPLLRYGLEIRKQASYFYPGSKNYKGGNTECSLNLSYVSLCVFVCMYVSLCVYFPLCAWVYVYFMNHEGRCLRSISGIFLSHFLLLFMRRVLSVYLKLAYWTRLVGEQTLGLFLSRLLWYWDSRCLLLHLASLVWVLSSELRSLCLCDEHFSLWVISNTGLLLL